MVSRWIFLPLWRASRPDYGFFPPYERNHLENPPCLCRFVFPQNHKNSSYDKKSALHVLRKKQASR